MVSGLTVEFAGEVHEVDASLTFGRASDLCIDENQYMHRCVGEFVRDGNLWWLRNRGSRIPITLISGGGKRVQLPPGATQALSDGGGVVRFQAGQANYELNYWGVANGPQHVVEAASGEGEGGDQTLRFSIDLTPREVDYLVSLCAPRLQSTTTTAPPTYAEVAATWGVSVKTLDNTLQQLRRKIRDAGLTGADSSEALATFALQHGLIDQSDLDWAALGTPDGPRMASRGPRFA